MSAKALISLIGNTPCIELEGFPIEGCEIGVAQIWAKLESFNPGGSVKDRTVLSMLDLAKLQGRLKPGSVIVEATSGNTGIALAMISAALGYRCIIVMPDSMSLERRKTISAFGAELVLTNGALGMSEAVKTASLIAEKRGGIILGQFENPANSLAHERTTGPEIISQMSGKIDALVAGIGTGGTITGIARSFKKARIPAKIIGVEPAESPVITKGQTGKHAIEGIGAGFVPKILDRELLDEVIAIESTRAKSFTCNLSSKFGIFCGISSGAALAAAAEVARRLGEGKRVVTIFPDSGFKYLSTSLFE